MTSRSQPTEPNAERDKNPPQAARKAIRASVERFLVRRPEHGEDGHETVVLEVHAAIDLYLRPAAQAPEAIDSPPEPEANPARLERVASRASSLVESLEELDPGDRRGLLTATRIHPGDLEAFKSLGRRIACDATATPTLLPDDSGAEAAASPPPEIELIENLRDVWLRYTDERIARDREATSAWANFVEVACHIAGIDPDTAHRLRVRAYDTAALDESAEILASIPPDA
ncbi:MAG: hypothetical protein QF570_05490 [Myxococcota bacterium]|nr:hypothetical protein [Myxococcota bacterium]